jgi:hypothetical protein
MKKYFLAAACLYNISLAAQNNTASNLIEGGKTLVELVRVFKTPKNNIAASTAAAQTPKTDSCAFKNISDISFKNSTAKSLYITLVKRNGAGYETQKFTIKVLPKAQEYFYEMRTGIYHLKIETDGDEESKILFKEGEIKLTACENTLKEIKPE